jgi:hypothetical protein
MGLPQVHLATALPFFISRPEDGFQFRLSISLQYFRAIDGATEYCDKKGFKHVKNERGQHMLT